MTFTGELFQSKIFQRDVNWKSGQAIISLATVPSVLLLVTLTVWVLLAMIELVLLDVHVVHQPLLPPVS